MSPENADAAPRGAEHPRLLTSTTILGLVCFGGGLLLLAAGVLLALGWLVTQNPLSLFGGILLALLGVGVNVTGLVLLYRGVTGRGAVGHAAAGNNPESPRLGPQGGPE